jgi:BlaI family penicillinase repressor
MTLHISLSRRERQIMDALFRRGRATAAEVMADLPGEPSYSTVRTQLRVLEEKGHVRHEDDGVRFIYTPVIRRQSARRSALRHLVDTFFEGSAEKTVAALLGGEASRITDEELDRIAALLEKSRKDEERRPGVPADKGRR